MAANFSVPGMTIGTERSDRGPHVGVCQGQPERAASTHRDAGEVDAIAIHREPAFDIGDHVVDISLRDALISHAAARERGGDDVTGVAHDGEKAHVFGIRLAEPRRNAEDLAEVRPVVGLFGMQADDQRVAAPDSSDRGT